MVGRRSIERRSAAVYALAALVLGGVAACDAPDRSAERRLTLGDALLEAMTPDTVRTRSVHPGVTYHYVWAAEGPWAIHLVAADLGQCEVGFSVLRPAARRSGGEGRATTSRMVFESDEPILAAVNADFFTPEGATVGTEVVDGRVTASASRPTFAWHPDRGPWMGLAEAGADGVDVGWRVDATGDGDTEAVGGFPDLIDSGAPVGDLEVRARPTFAAARHPRTAVGYDSAGDVLWLVVVDGRQLPHSAGMTLPELARLFGYLGADEALNLDGGGSSAMVIDGRPVNRPSDPTGERAVANALALVRDGSFCEVGGR
ncbi:MAG: phosphodiester glycosidase family protein [Gemmatimonadota bacterium]